MTFLVEIDQLPTKVLTHLPADVATDYIAGVKTTVKPNATIPFLWMVIHKGGILFCSTHRTRGLFKELAFDELDSIKVINGSRFNEPRVELIQKDLDVDDFVVTFPELSDLCELRQLFEKAGYQVL